MKISTSLCTLQNWNDNNTPVRNNHFRMANKTYIL